VPTAWTIKTPPARTSVRCARHPDVDAAFRCGRCNAQLCSLCVKHGEERGVKFRLCSCGGRCEAVVVAAPPRRAAEVGGELADSFRFPFCGESLGPMAVGAAMYGIFGWLFGGSLANSIGRVSPRSSYGPLALWATMGALIALLGVSGYLFAYVELVIVHTAKGRDDPPGFPDFLSTWDSMWQPLVRLVLLLAISFGPGVVLVALLPGLAKIAGVVVLFAGLAWFPAALVAVAIFEGDQGFDPRLALAVIRVAPGPYAIAAALLVASSVAMVAGDWLLAPLPGVGGLLSGALTFYMATVAGRVLGLAYRHHAERLGWF
jgi:hypothetical protein